MAFKLPPALAATVLFVSVTSTRLSVGGEPRSFSSIDALFICTVCTAVAFGGSKLLGIGDSAADDCGLVSVEFGFDDVEECKEFVVGAKMGSVKLK